MSSDQPGAPSLDVVRRNNNFDGLRLVAAVGVIVGHAFVLLGRPEDLPHVWGIAPHVLGVSVFFTISGWLITGSWERSHSVGQYVSSRVLRILPLLFLVILTSTFLVGPLVTTLSTGDYFANPMTWHYLVNLMLLPSDSLPGVFDTLPYPGVVNGSVWTLRAEVICYVAVLIFGLMPRQRQLAGFVLFGLLAVTIAEAGSVIIAGASISAAAGAWVYFVVGALAKLLVPRQAFRTDVALGVALAWAAIAAIAPEQSTRLSWLTLPYVVLSAGLASWPVMRRAARWGDLSYGMYLWAFPVQQLLILYVGTVTIGLDVVVVVTICGVLSLATWHLLEKPALDARYRLRWFRPKRVDSATT